MWIIVVLIDLTGERLHMEGVEAVAPGEAVGQAGLRALSVKRGGWQGGYHGASRGPAPCRGPNQSGGVNGRSVRGVGDWGRSGVLWQNCVYSRLTLNQNILIGLDLIGRRLK